MILLEQNLFVSRGLLYYDEDLVVDMKTGTMKAALLQIPSHYPLLGEVAAPREAVVQPLGGHGDTGCTRFFSFFLVKRHTSIKD